MVTENDLSAARVASGGLLSMESLLLALHPPARIIPELDEPFVDPIDERTP